MRDRPLLLPLTLVLLALAGLRRDARETGRSHAPRWRGDFETGNLLQWSYLLNPRGLSVVDSPVAEGRHAARVEITERDLWPNGLNRVEVEYKPPRATLAEGQRSCFSWRFFLPAPLSEARHQIGYWESYPSYKQIMSFEVHGQTIAFVTRMPSERVHWTAPGAVTPNVWHQLATCASGRPIPPPARSTSGSTASRSGPRLRPDAAGRPDKRGAPELRPNRHPARRPCRARGDVPRRRGRGRGLRPGCATLAVGDVDADVRRIRGGRVRCGADSIHAAPARVRSAPIDSVNAVLGDASFVAAFGRPPGPGDSDEVRIRTHLAYVERRLRAVDVEAGRTTRALAARRTSIASASMRRPASSRPAKAPPAGCRRSSTVAAAAARSLIWSKRRRAPRWRSPSPGASATRTSSRSTIRRSPTGLRPPAYRAPSWR